MYVVYAYESAQQEEEEDLWLDLERWTAVPITCRVTEIASDRTSIMQNVYFVKIKQLLTGPFRSLIPINTTQLQPISSDFSRWYVSKTPKKRERGRINLVYHRLVYIQPNWPKLLVKRLFLNWSALGTVNDYDLDKSSVRLKNSGTGALIRSCVAVMFLISTFSFLAHSTQRSYIIKMTKESRAAYRIWIVNVVTLIANELIGLPGVFATVFESKPE